MTDRASSFDTSRLQALANLRAEQKALRDLAGRAAAHRDKVAEVYTRVVQNYEARIQALESQAEQLRQQVQADFEQVEQVYREAERTLDQADSDVQENEFRHAIGEFSKEEFGRRLASLEQTIAAKRAELDRLGRLRQECLGLLGPDAAMPAASGAGTPATTALGLASVPSTGVAVLAGRPLDAALATSETDVPAIDGQPEQTGASQPDGTPDESATQFFGTTPWSEEAAGGPAASQPAEGLALLVEERPEGGTVSHELSERVGIGRTTDNQVVVPSREVSRRHAEIVRGPDGYTLRDLSTPNGSFVNGERVQERRLQEGDRVAIGPQIFVFRAR